MQREKYFFFALRSLSLSFEFKQKKSHEWNANEVFIFSNLLLGGSYTLYAWVFAVFILVLLLLATFQWEQIGWKICENKKKYIHITVHKCAAWRVCSSWNSTKCCSSLLRVCFLFLLLISIVIESTEYQSNPQCVLHTRHNHNVSQYSLTVNFSSRSIALNQVKLFAIAIIWRKQRDKWHFVIHIKIKSYFVSARITVHFRFYNRNEKKIYIDESHAYQPVRIR